MSPSLSPSPSFCSFSSESIKVKYTNFHFWPTYQTPIISNIWDWGEGRHRDGGVEKYSHSFIHSFSKHFVGFPDRSMLRAGNTTKKIYTSSWISWISSCPWSFATLTKKLNLSRIGRKDFPK